jgi:2'-5' RNA ligase
MKEKIRAFVALEIETEVRENLGKLVDRFRAKVDHVKWVEPDNMHMTLKFLGEVPSIETHQFAGDIETITAATAPFTLTWRGCGAFPNLRAPRTLWVGTTTGSEAVTHLAEGIEEAMVERGIPAERRRFKPHLTIGRARRGNRPTAVVSNLLEKHADAELGSTRVEKIVLFSSELTRSGPIYTKLATMPLQGK